MTDQLATLLSEDRRFPPHAGVHRPGQRHAGATTRPRPAIAWASGRSTPGSWSGSSPGRGCWSGLRRTRSGSSAASSTSRSIASTATSPARARNKAALIWEGEPGDRRTLTYWDLAREVGRAANALRALGVRKGDRVAIYLPMIPEAAIAMLACTRIGAVHSVVFGGFSAEALRDRINDAQAVAVITADGGYRRGAVVPLKRFTDQALEGCPSVGTSWSCIAWADTMAPTRASPPCWRDATTGGTGCSTRPPRTRSRRSWTRRTSCSSSIPRERPASPRGSSTPPGGYLTQARGHHEVGLRSQGKRPLLVHRRHRLGDRTLVRGLRTAGQRRHRADVRRRRRTGRSRDRFWKLVARYGVTVFYTAPTAIRAFMKWGTEHAGQATTCRRSGSWAAWASRSIPRRGCGTTSTSAGRRCPIVDTWWQTETGGIMITPLPGVVTTKPGSATIPFPGISAELVDAKGNADRDGRRLPHAHRALARDAPDDLRRRRALPARPTGAAFPGRYFAGRRRQARCRRVLVGAGPGGRRDERGGTPDRVDGDRERAGGSPRGGGGRGGRQAARPQGHRRSRRS